MIDAVTEHDDLIEEGSGRVASSPGRPEPWLMAPSDIGPGTAAW